MGASWVDLNSQDSVVVPGVVAVSEHRESSLLADFQPSSSHGEEESEEGNRRRASFGGRSGLLCEHVGSVWSVGSRAWEGVGGYMITTTENTASGTAYLGGV